MKGLQDVYAGCMTVDILKGPWNIYKMFDVWQLQKSMKDPWKIKQNIMFVDKWRVSANDTVEHLSTIYDEVEVYEMYLTCDT